MPEFPIEAVTFCKKLPGSSQAVLTRCSDGRIYAVKFTNNPNGARSLASEVVTTRLAHRLRLPVPDYSFVYVDEWLVSHTDDIGLVCERRIAQYDSGVQYGSLTPYKSVQDRQVYEYLPSRRHWGVDNQDSFSGILLLDIWMGRLDSRQVIFVSTGPSRLEPQFIDHRSNLNRLRLASQRSQPPLCRDTQFYEGVRGWGAFEPWLTAIEEISEGDVEHAVALFPENWGVSDEWKQEAKSYLLGRNRCIRSMISELRKSEPGLFPNWGKAPCAARVTTNVLEDRPRPFSLSIAAGSGRQE